jgi:hypothetical protein
MTAAEAREQLEAEMWRILGFYTKTPRVHHVDRLLTLADACVHASVGEALDDRARDRRLADADASAAEHLERLAQATAERTGRP